jgi:SAM-dependent methyltransferase
MNEEFAHQGFRDDSYQLSGLADPVRELERLERQARIATPLELSFLRKLGLPASGCLLDVGCGPGVFTEAMASLAPQGRAIGVDAEAGLVRRGRRRLAGQNERVRLVHASAEDMPFDDAEFDLAYARFLFQHLPRPQRVLGEMRRVVKPGGRVVVVDTDDVGLVLHPEPQGFQSLLDASQSAQRRRGGDRQVGRKLKSILMEGGLTDVQVQVVPFTSEQVGMEAFLDICLGFKSLIIDGEMAPGAIEETLAEARALIADPSAFGHALAYVATGTVAAR